MYHPHHHHKIKKKRGRRILQKKEELSEVQGDTCKNFMGSLSDGENLSHRDQEDLVKNCINQEENSCSESDISEKRSPAKWEYFFQNSINYAFTEMTRKCGCTFANFRRCTGQKTLLNMSTQKKLPNKKTIASCLNNVILLGIFLTVFFSSSPLLVQGQPPPPLPPAGVRSHLPFSYQKHNFILICTRISKLQGCKLLEIITSLEPIIITFFKRYITYTADCGC